MHLAVVLGAKLLAAGGAAAGAAGAAGSAIAGAAGTAFTAAKGFLGLSGAAAGASGASSIASAGAAHAGIANIAGAAGATAGKSALLGKLALAGSTLSAFTSFAGGMADKREAEAQALEARYGARQAILQGAQQSNDVLDGVIDEMAKTRVAYARAGLDAFSGSAQGAINRIGADGEADIDVTRGDALVRYFSARRTMKALKARGSASGLSGIVEAGAKAIGGYVSFKERG